MATAPRANPKVVPIEEVAPPPAEPKKSSKKLILVLAGILLLLFTVGIGWYFVANSPADPNAEPEQEQALPPVFLAMEPFTVNLQQEISEQYLQVAFTLQVEDQAQIEAIKLYMPLVRSRILMLLGNQKASELNTEEGKKKLQEEIAAQVSLPFTPKAQPQKVTGVFFTSFVIQ